MALAAASDRRAIDLTRHVPVAVDVAVAVLEAAPQRVIGSHLGAPWSRPEGHANLGVEPLGGKQVTREVRIGLGTLLEDDDALALPLWWEAAEHPRFFPTFDGGLELRGDGDGTELRLVGSYQPPLGLVGRFADGLVGHRMVVASLETFLTDVAERLVAAAFESL